MAARNYFGKLAIVMALGLGVVSCDSSPNTNSAGGGKSMSEMAAALEAKRAEEKKEQQRLEADRKAEEMRQAAATAALPPEQRPRKEAKRDPIGQGGYYTAIVGARRHILNEIDDLAWGQAVDHFKATEGRKPKDHDEFMKRIVIPLGINLGYIEENQEFLYDPNGERDDGRDIGQLYLVEKVAAPTFEQAPQP